MLENNFKTKLVREIKNKFSDCFVLHGDANSIQGIPDLFVLYRNKWAALEGKKNKNASHRPNQDYYVNKINTTGFARFVYPENKDEVLSDMECYFNE